MLRRIRGYFFSGLLVVVPIGVTVWIVWGIFNLFDSWFRVLAQELELSFMLPSNTKYLHGVGFILTISLITLTGFMTQLYFGRKILDIIDFFFNKIPFVSSIYNGLKQIGETLLGRQTKLFEWVGLTEYPRRGLYSLAFVMSKDKKLVSQITNQDMLYVFVPTTPNPTSGYFLIIPEDDVIRLNITIEDGMKMIISSGMVAPKTFKEIEKRLEDIPDPVQEPAHKE